MAAISSRNKVYEHRTNVTAVDKIVPPTISAAANEGVIGEFTTNTRGVVVVAGNSMGGAGKSNLVTLTPSAAKAIDVTIPPIVGAEYFDVFLSASSVAPLKVATVTAAMVADTGATVAVDGTITAEGTPGKVTILSDGTGPASTETRYTYNNAYILTGIEPILVEGDSTIKVFPKLTTEDSDTAAKFTLLPFITPNELNSTDWYACDDLALEIESGAGETKKQALELPMDGPRYLLFAVDDIAGDGAKLNLKVEVVKK